MSVFAIRSAEPNLSDARTLLDVERASLGDSDFTPMEALALIRRPEQHAYLAHQDGEPVGFCSCLETPRASGWRVGGWRLEIDMLGVCPASRGQGIATALIEHSVFRGRLRGVHSFRAVVAQANVASQRAFAGAGFAASDRVEMVVHEVGGRSGMPSLPAGWTHQVWMGGSFVHAGEEWSARGPGHEIHALSDGKGEIVALAEVLHVFTLAYVGLWIERLSAARRLGGRAMARALVERAKRLGCDEVGYLGPTEDRHAGVQTALLREGYACVGRYLVLAR